jgi:hypothetical protein
VSLELLRAGAGEQNRKESQARDVEVFDLVTTCMASSVNLMARVKYGVGRDRWRRPGQMTEAELSNRFNRRCGGLCHVTVNTRLIPPNVIEPPNGATN